MAGGFTWLGGVGPGRIHTLLVPAATRCWGEGQRDNPAGARRDPGPLRQLHLRRSPGVQAPGVCSLECSDIFFPEVDSRTSMFAGSISRIRNVLQFF